MVDIFDILVYTYKRDQIHSWDLNICWLSKECILPLSSQKIYDNVYKCKVNLIYKVEYLFIVQKKRYKRKIQKQHALGLVLFSIQWRDLPEIIQSVPHFRVILIIYKFQGHFNS